MKYICAQPATQYFGWQVDVLINSLISNGVFQKNIHVINATHGQIDSYFDKLKNKYPYILFEFYEDTRDYKEYIPSIKQHLLQKHYKKYNYLENETILLLDADVAFIKPIDFSPLLNDDIWYLSDTNSYLNYDYILSKGIDVLCAMVEIADIDEQILKDNNKNSGGAQYLVKNAKASYWGEVVELSHKLFKNITELNNKKVKEDPSHHPLQIWTAEMWALLWVAWKNDINTKNSEIMDFCWATDNIKKWDQVKIFHNAGVTAEMKDLFFKAGYIDQLPNNNLNINPNKCSYNYYQIVKKILT
jgi:hypothetical protein